MIGPKRERNVVRCPAAVCGGEVQGIATKKEAARRLEQDMVSTHIFEYKEYTSQDPDARGEPPLQVLRPRAKQKVRRLEKRKLAVLLHYGHRKN